MESIRQAKQSKDFTGMSKLIFMIALGASAVATPVMAQTPGGGERGQFMQRDETKAEAQQRADTLFQLLDANKDGTVTRAEADQALARFDAEDTNHDGTLTAAERQQARAQRQSGGQ
jgi:hypothetical protein